MRLVYCGCASLGEPLLELNDRVGIEIRLNQADAAVGFADICDWRVPGLALRNDNIAVASIAEHIVALGSPEPPVGGDVGASDRIEAIFEILERRTGTR